MLSISFQEALMQLRIAQLYSKTHTVIRNEQGKFMLTSCSLNFRRASITRCTHAMNQLFNVHFAIVGTHSIENLVCNSSDYIIEMLQIILIF